MDTSKMWWQSNTCWANLLQMLTSFAVMAHLISEAQASAIVADGPALIVSAVMLGLGFWGFWGRIIATKTIAK